MGTVCRIIIVDDEVLVRQGIKHLLQWEQEGFEIVGEASNGQEALKLVAEVQPHIVITDIVMPQMDGIELTSLVKEHYPSIEVIVLSSFSEFNYVRDTFQKGAADYILKPKLDAEQLLTILNRTAKRIPSLQLEAKTDAHQPNVSQLLDRLLAGYELNEGDSDTIELIPHAHFRILGTELKNGQINTMKEQLMQKLEDIFLPFNSSLNYYLLPTEANTVAMLLNSTDQQWAKIIPAIRALANSARWKSERFIWSLGNSFSSLSELHIQYQQFMKTIAFRYFLPEDRTFLLAEELPRLTDPEPIFNMSSFMEKLQQRKINDAIEMIMSYVDAVESHYSLDVFAFKSLIGNIIFNTIVMLNKLEINTKVLDAEKYNYFKTINESSHISEVRSQLQLFIEAVKEAVNKSKQLYSNANLTMIIDYIHEHYMESISLSDVANHFHFNPSYLSSFFSSHHAEGFNEYLNRVRVDKAAELLQLSDQAIADISVQVGYSDHSYFTKVFKKLKGMSPSQYRKSFLM